MEILRNNQKKKKMLDIKKKTLTEMKNVFDGLISRLDMTEERTSELENGSIKSSRTEKQREQRLGEKKTEKNIRGLWDKYKRHTLFVM